MYSLAKCSISDKYTVVTSYTNKNRKETITSIHPVTGSIHQAF